MPLVDAPATVASAAPSGTAGGMAPGIGTLAGALIAWLGTVLPSGSPWLSLLAADATPSAPAMLAVQAADSRANGTSEAALLLRPLSFADMRRVSLVRNRSDSPKSDEPPVQRVSPSGGTPNFRRSPCETGRRGAASMRRSRAGIMARERGICLAAISSPILRPSRRCRGTPNWSPSRGQGECRGAPSRVRRVVRPRARRHAGRRELAGARVRRRGRHATLHGGRRGSVAARRRRQRVRRPGLLLGPDAAGACPPRGAGGRERGGRPRDVVRDADHD